MAAGPMRLLDGGDLAGAESAFDSLLSAAAARHGPLSVEVADRLTAFGLGLFMSDGEDARLRSLDYLRRAIPVYRAAFGPDHAEVALAIGTYADAALQLTADDPPQDLDAALEDEYRIRVATRGAADGVTMLALLNIADVRGAPSRTGGEAARIAAAAQIYRRAISVLETKPYAPDEPTAISAFFGIARMYVRNRRLPEAVAAVIEARNYYRRSDRDRGEMCGVLNSQFRRFTQFLGERGYSTTAEELGGELAQDISCFENALDAIGPAPAPAPNT